MPRLSATLILGSLLGLAATSAATAPASAGQALNSHTGKWETVAPGSVLHQNQYTGEWEFGPPDATTQLNPMTNKWEVAPPGAVPTFDSDSNTWTLQAPGATKERSPYTGRDEYLQ